MYIYMYTVPIYLSNFLSIILPANNASIAIVWGIVESEPHLAVSLDNTLISSELPYTLPFIDR